MLLPVDDDGRDLLVHEDEDGGEDCEHRGEEDVHPPGVEQHVLGEEEGVAHHPVPPLPGRLEGARHHQLGRGQPVEVVQQRHQQDADDHREVGQESSDRVGKEARGLELFEAEADEEGPEEEEEGHEEDIVPVSTPSPLPLAALPRLAAVEARALQLRHLLADAERVLEGALNKC